MKKIYYMIAMAFMAITFTSCEDVPESYGKPVSPIIPYEPAGTGVETDPFNVAGAIEKCKEIGGKASTEKYYIKGYAAGAAEVDGGKITFTMTDSKEGKGKKFTAYKVAGSDNKSLPSDFAVSIGEEIVLYGPIYYYNNKTPETATGAYIVTVNGEKTGGGDTPTPSGDPKGTGTKDDPFNIAAAIAKCVEIGTNPSTEKYYVKGIAVKDATASGGFGNISIDLGDSKDATAIFKAFQVAGTDGEKLADGYKVNTGDEVVVYGPIYNYQGNTPETAGKSAAQIVTINGKSTSESGGGDTPSEETKTATIAEFLAAPVSTNVWYQLTGTIKSLKDGDKYGNFDLEDETGSVYVYGLLSEKGGAKQKFQELVAAQGLQAGTKITIIGNRGEYNGNPQVLNAYFVKVESGGGSGGGDTPSGGNDGSLAKPFTPAEANAFIATLAADTNTDKDYYIKGKLAKYANNGEFSTQYGNASFYLSADGSESGEQFYVFRTLYLGNVKYTEGTTPAVGDEIIICGQLVNYKGNTPETVANKSYIYSLNGNTK